MAIDRFRSLAVFVRVAETGSFTRAADGLGLPRSTVSMILRDLEQRLGTRLLHRTTRQVRLTQDGLVAYERCTRLLAELEETETLFLPWAQPVGRLRLDVPGRIGRRIIAPALPAFLARHPGIEIELGVTDRPVDLVQDGVDCAVRVGDLADSSLVVRRLGELELINCASPDYLARHGLPEVPGDLQQHQAVHYASPGTGRIAPWEYVLDGQVASLALPGRVTVNNAEAYIACCLAGLGLIQIPGYDVAHHLVSGALVEVLRPWRTQPMPISLLYPHRPHLSRRLQVLVAWLEELLGGLTGVGASKGLG